VPWACPLANARVPSPAHIGFQLLLSGADPLGIVLLRKLQPMSHLMAFNYG
jgi:hypothetical protein